MMKFKASCLALLLFTFSGVFMLSCKNSSSTGPEQEQVQDKPSGEPAIPSGSPQGNSNETDDLAKLTNALPASIYGINKVALPVKQGMLNGSKVFVAEATYEQGERKISLNIIDSGGHAEVIKNLAPWAGNNLNNESEQGYERNTIIDGKKAIERYNKKTKDGVIGCIISDRYIVNIDTKHLSGEELHDIVSLIKI